MSSSGIPIDSTKRNRKSSEPNRIVLSPIQSPSIMNSNSSPFSSLGDISLAQLQAAINGATASSGAAQTTDQTMIFNLASAIAMNTFLAMPNPNNPMIANVAKMIISLNVLNQQQSELLGGNSRPDLSQLGLSPMLLQQYASLMGRGQAQQNVQASQAIANSQNSSLSSFQQPLKNSSENQRKRSLGNEHTALDNNAKRIFGDTGNATMDNQPAVPLSKDDIENSLIRILNEEIYNIYDETMKSEAQDQQLSPGQLTLISESRASSSSDNKGACRPSPNEEIPIESMNLFEILELLASDVSSDMGSTGSAFRKVSSKSEIGSTASSSSESSQWGNTISPPNSSPQSIADLSPLSNDTQALIQEVVLNLKSSIEAEKESQFPALWRGQILMKHNATLVQMHLVQGSKDFLTDCLGELADQTMIRSTTSKPSMRINQRMRADNNHVQNLLLKLNSGIGCACLCLPIGFTREECNINNEAMKTQFMDYFSNKSAAGIANLPRTDKIPASLVYVFPPNDFTESYMKTYSESLFDRIRRASQNGVVPYLFIVIVPSDEPVATAQAD
ncbi:unnamed protein product [Auanema sp. JU1783]|nr:unnamed protein product [Auanema sp. JU1783]